MLFLKRLMIDPSQRGLMFVDGELKAVLQPGKHRLMQWRRTVRVDLISIGNGDFTVPNAEFLMRTAGDVLAPHVEQIDIGEAEVGLVYREDRLVGMLAPGARRFYWRAP